MSRQSRGDLDAIAGGDNGTCFIDRSHFGSSREPNPWLEFPLRFATSATPSSVLKTQVLLVLC